MSNYSAWKIKASNFPADAPLKTQLMFLCGYGILAPSVHNTQPWKFEIGPESIKISISAERALGAGDPIGRQTWISLGACAENILIAGEYFGLHGKLNYLDDKSAEFKFVRQQPKPGMIKLINAITERATNRGLYKAKELPNEAVKEMEGVALQNVHVSVKSDREIINKIADLTGRAIAIALSNPSFRHELSSLIRPNWTRLSTGMPGFSLGVSGARSAIEHRLVKSGTMISHQSKKETAAVQASGAVVLISSDGDTPKFWLSAGQAYQRAGLIAVANGLSCATTAAVVEAADYHLDVEEKAHIEGRLQVVMRLGYGQSAAKHSPRLTLEDVATFSS